MESYMVWIWLGVFIICFVVEAVTTELVSIWFCIGAIVSFILSLINGIPYYIELVVFTLVSLVLLLVTRPFIKKIMKNQKRNTNVDAIIGTKVKMLTEASYSNPGSIKINDIVYTAVVADEKEILLKDEEVKIVAVQGNKMICKKIGKEN